MQNHSAAPQKTFLNFKIPTSNAKTVSIPQKDCKALAKRTRKSTQVNASLQNQNLRTDLRRVAKRIRKSARKSQKAVNFTHIIG